MWFLAPPSACTRLPCRAASDRCIRRSASSRRSLPPRCRGWARIASTASLSPWTTLNTPSGRPASLSSSASQHRRRGIALGRLQDEGVAAGHRDRKHPHRHHGREVERGDAGDDSSASKPPRRSAKRRRTRGGRCRAPLSARRSRSGSSTSSARTPGCSAPASTTSSPRPPAPIRGGISARCSGAPAGSSSSSRSATRSRRTRTRPSTPRRGCSTRSPATASHRTRSDARIREYRTPPVAIAWMSGFALVLSLLVGWKYNPWHGLRHHRDGRRSARDRRLHARVHRLHLALPTTAASVQPAAPPRAADRRDRAVLLPALLPVREGAAAVPVQVRELDRARPGRSRASY